MKLLFSNTKMIQIFALLFFVALFVSSCSSVSDENKKDESTITTNQLDTIKSVDNTPSVDSKVEVPKSFLYIIQIGAYSTFEKAKKFRESIKNKLSEEIFVSFDKRTSLYVVRLKPRETRAEAEEIRTKLRATK